MILPSTELLSKVLCKNVYWIANNGEVYEGNRIVFVYTDKDYRQHTDEINIYGLQHENLKEWTKSKNCFDIIDWSASVDEIFEQAERAYTEINKRDRDS